MNTDEIKELLELTGWSEVELAARLHVSQYAVRKWLKGSVPGGPAGVLMRDWLATARKAKARMTPTA